MQDQLFRRSRWEGEDKCEIDLRKARSMLVIGRGNVRIWLSISVGFFVAL
jgi:hypothetical protein